LSVNCHQTGGVTEDKYS